MLFQITHRKKRFNQIGICFIAHVVLVIYALLNPTNSRDTNMHLHLIGTIRFDSSSFRVFKTSEINDYLPLGLKVYRTANDLLPSSNEINCKSLSIVLGVLTILFLWNSFKEISHSLLISDSIALFALFNLKFLDAFTQVNRDTLYLFAFSFSLYFLITFIKYRTLTSFFLISVFVALSISFRFEATELLLVFPCIIIIFSKTKTFTIFKMEPISLLFSVTALLFIFDLLFFDNKIHTVVQICRKLENFIFQ